MRKLTEKQRLYAEIRKMLMTQFKDKTTRQVAEIIGANYSTLKGFYSREIRVSKLIAEACAASLGGEYAKLLSAIKNETTQSKLRLKRESGFRSRNRVQAQNAERKARNRFAIQSMKGATLPVLYPQPELVA